MVTCGSNISIGQLLKIYLWKWIEYIRETNQASWSVPFSFIYIAPRSQKSFHLKKSILYSVDHIDLTLKANCNRFFVGYNLSSPHRLDISRGTQPPEIVVLWLRHIATYVSQCQPIKALPRQKSKSASARHKFPKVTDCLQQVSRGASCETLPAWRWFIFWFRPGTIVQWRRTTFI